MTSGTRTFNSTVLSEMTPSPVLCSSRHLAPPLPPNKKHFRVLILSCSRPLIHIHDNSAGQAPGRLETEPAASHLHSLYREIRTETTRFLHLPSTHMTFAHENRRLSGKHVHSHTVSWETNDRAQNPGHI